jgi:hypothetical protein
MRKLFKVVLGLGVALSAAGCSDFLSAPDVTADPTKVTQITKPGPLYIGVQEAGPPQREGQIARFAAEYTQQIAGFSRQQIGYDLYQATPSATDTYFGAIYGTSNALTGGGGLLDIHKLQQLARANNDSLYLGIGKVYEAMYMGFAADIWGDIPYREAADSTKLTPHFDPQLQIYADLQTQLDSAITFFTATGLTNQGPAADGSELIYQGATPDELRVIYTEVAHSLKARLYMHTAERDLTAYAKAAAETALGISTPDNDFLWFHDASPNGLNIWWAFMLNRGDIGPGAALVEIMKRRIATSVEGPERLAFYFQPTASGGFFGYRPGGTTNMPTTGGIDPGNGDAGAYSLMGAAFDGNTPPGDFRQPEITWAETQLIAAEAAFNAGGQGAAQPFLDAVRANRKYGSTGGAAVTFPPLGAIPATLPNIIEEKYTTLFLNPEVWNDYKRTCLPSLAPAPNSVASGSAPRTTGIAGRLPYGLSEHNANPNIPAENPIGRNANDPNPCPALNYTSSSPLAN